jgi:hypothetical protein
MTVLDNLITRARYCRDAGNFDNLHAELLDMVEFLAHEFEVERDRANEHFEGRTAAEANALELARRIDLMRELHRPTPEPGGPLRCKECREHWPCDTSWKLDGLHGQP